MHVHAHTHTVEIGSCLVVELAAPVVSEIGVLQRAHPQMDQ